MGGALLVDALVLRGHPHRALFVLIYSGAIFALWGLWLLVRWLWERSAK